MINRVASLVVPLKNTVLAIEIFRDIQQNLERANDVVWDHPSVNVILG